MNYNNIKRMSFHTFGDSHSSKTISAWNIIPNIKDHHIGGCLCYSFGRDKLNRLNIRNYGVKENDTVCFCFGEIDCRTHVHKYITPHNNYKIIIIDEIIKNYFESIKLNIQQYNKLKICVYNVVPPRRYIKLSKTHPYPYLGTDEERKLYYNYFNEQLKINCFQKNYIFFDIYDKYTDNNGFLNRLYSDSCGCHIINGKYILEFYNNNVK